MAAVGPVKLFADGGVEPSDRRAARRRPSAPATRSRHHRDVATAIERGFRVAVHAIGNAGLQRAYAFADASARRPDDDHRFRVEHACLRVVAAGPPRSARSGAVAVVQPAFVEMLGSRVGHLRFADATGCRSPTSPGPGCRWRRRPTTVMPCRPLADSLLGVTRTLVSGRVSGPTRGSATPTGCTRGHAGAAYAGGQERERGTLTPGKRADLVVVDGPLDGSAVPQVAQTWVAGRCVYP